MRSALCPNWSIRPALLNVLATSRSLARHRGLIELAGDMDAKSECRLECTLTIRSFAWRLHDPSDSMEPSISMHSRKLSFRCGCHMPLEEVRAQRQRQPIWQETTYPGGRISTTALT